MYLAELRAEPLAVDAVLNWCYKGPITLIYAAKDTQHSHAIVLREHLTARLAEREKS